MAALTSAQHVFMFLWIIGSVAAEDLEVTAEPGEDVTLQCHSHTDAAVTKLVWSRSELKDVNVFFFRNNRPYDSFQDPRYRGRVELKDPEMKNGDASVVLTKFNVSDTGTYQCRVTTSNMPTKLVNSVHLSVSEGPPKEDLEEELNKRHRRNVGLGVGLGLGCPLVGVAGYAIKRFAFPKPKRDPLPSPDECDAFKE
ncbi:coxsackievirus and adenovirus receptor-like [Trematomus bernacchii]|uniref:coxsackievirus and adenovirus receptor-like n=1 Tax=Trematomus bernacchii TaxID=40690 RepID=UPI00146F2E79|nr:coxsackievirus and adenovirus receptor-like [Trematomus bernacchii]